MSEHEPEVTPETSRATPTDVVVPVVTRFRGTRGVEGTSRRGLFIVIPLVMAAGAIAGVVLNGMKDNAIYSKPVDELVAQKSKSPGARSAPRGCSSMARW